MEEENFRRERSENKKEEESFQEHSDERKIGKANT